MSKIRPLLGLFGARINKSFFKREVAVVLSFVLALLQTVLVTSVSQSALGSLL